MPMSHVFDAHLFPCRMLNLSTGHVPCRYLFNPLLSLDFMSSVESKNGHVNFGALDGGGGDTRFHMSILRNAHVALSNLRNAHVTLSILRNDHVPCHYLFKAHVACH